MMIDPEDASASVIFLSFLNLYHTIFNVVLDLFEILAVMRCRVIFLLRPFLIFSSYWYYKCELWALVFVTLSRENYLTDSYKTCYVDSLTSKAIHT